MNTEAKFDNITEPIWRVFLAGWFAAASAYGGPAEGEEEETQAALDAFNEWNRPDEVGG